MTISKTNKSFKQGTLVKLKNPDGPVPIVLWRQIVVYSIKDLTARIIKNDRNAKLFGIYLNAYNEKSGWHEIIFEDQVYIIHESNITEDFE